MLVYTVEHCYDFREPSLEGIFGTKAAADAYVLLNSFRGMIGTYKISEWEVNT